MFEILNDSIVGIIGCIIGSSAALAAELIKTKNGNGKHTYKQLLIRFAAYTSVYILAVLLTAAVIEYIVPLF